ncbi:MAG: Rab family GTPase [Candidatus Kariarchaeaceae archaeon]|jgi:small GTP-binding protein
MTNSKIKTKVVLCGDYRVGKTSLRRQYMGLTYMSQHMPTLGVDISTKSVNLGDAVVDLQIWDFGGQPAFEFLRKNYLLGASGALLIFDLTRLESFQNLDNWINEIKQGSDELTIPLVILGNKADLPDHQINEDMVTAYVNALKDRYNIYVDYSMTSAKTGLNVENSFFKLAQSISGVT